MNRFFKLTTIVLLAAMLLAAVSCAKPPVDDNGDVGGEVTTTAPAADQGGDDTTAAAGDTTPVETEAPELSDDIGDVTFGGKEFRIYAQDRFKSFSAAEDQIGETVNDAIYLRNGTVEDRLDIDLVFTFGTEDKMCSDFSTKVLSGSDEYELFLGHAVFASKYFTQGIYANWYDTEIDFSKPWFPEYVVKSGTINDKMYLLLSDVCLSAVARVYSVFYNIDEAKNFGLPDAFELVRNDEWTLDKLTELSKNVYRDNNADGLRDAGDLFGARCTNNGNYMCNYVYSLGMDNVVITEDCTIVDNFASENNLQKIEKLCYLFDDTDGGWDDDTFEESWSSFAHGNSLFTHGSLEWGQTYYKDQCTFSYGILPFPKYSAEQDYLSIVNGAASMSCLPRTVPTDRYDMIKAVFTVLCSETHKNVIPEYIGVTLQGKVADNPDSAEMITLILDGRTMDFAAIYDAFSGYVYSMDTIMGARTRLGSYLKGLSRTVTKHYNNVAEGFKK